MVLKSAQMKIRFWGVRGSIPTPLSADEVRGKLLAVLEKAGQDGLFTGANAPSRTDLEKWVGTLPVSLGGTFGGETTCVEVMAKDSPLIILDCGSGGRKLGQRLMQRLATDHHLNELAGHQATAREIHMFLTHFHWDHIQGFPFFMPAYMPGKRRANIFLYGKKNPIRSLEETLIGQQLYPNFPVAFQDLPCDMRISELPRLDSHPIALGKAEVHFQELTHPDAVFAYAISVGGRKFVMATDTEHKDVPDPRLLSIARDADILYYDAHYLPEEYVGTKGSLTGAMPKFDWGHSTYEWGVRSALAANVKTLLLGHHEPLRDDAGIEALLARARAFADELLARPEHAGKTLEILAAREGMEFSL